MLTPHLVPLSGGLARVASEILRNGPLSRAELARAVGLSQGSLTKIAKTLLDAGIIVELAANQSVSRGRRSLPLDLAVDSFRFFGIKVAADLLYGVATDFRGHVVAEESQALSTSSVDATLDAIASLYGVLQQRVGPASGVGISLAGKVLDQRTVVQSMFLGWENLDVAAEFQRRTGASCLVANDVVALATAEYWFGRAGGSENFALLTIGAGIGHAHMVAGAPVGGENVGVGLVGHVLLDAEGWLCPLGHRGCATAMLTVPGILGQARTLLRHDIEYSDLLAQAAAGHPLLRDLVDRVGRALGTMIALTCNFSLAQKIVLSGEGVGVAQVGQAALMSALREERHPSATVIEPILEEADFKEWARGAAVLALQGFLVEPEPRPLLGRAELSEAS